MKVFTISGKARHGKDTAAEVMKGYFEQKGQRVCVVHYADYLKMIAQKYFGWDGKKDEAGRTLLQVIGTNIAREKNPDMWVRVVCEFLAAFNEYFDVVIIPDTRFPNEIEYLREHGYDVTAIWMQRFGFKDTLTEEQKRHPSETALDGYPFDASFSCPNGVENVEHVIRSYLSAQEMPRTCEAEIIR